MASAPSTSTHSSSVSPNGSSALPSPSPSPPPPSHHPHSSETSPLLPGSKTTTLDSYWHRYKTPYLYGLFILIIVFGSSLRTAPLVRLVELTICRRYYAVHDPSRVDGNGNVPEAECKLNMIQGELAMLRAWLSVLYGLVGVLVALPFGMLADAKGRRGVLAASMLSITLSESWVIIVCYFSERLPLRAILGSAAFQLLGGGDTVLNAVGLAAIADSVPADRRTAVFFYTSTATLVSELIAMPLGAHLMSKMTLYTAVISSTVLEFSGIFVLLVIPETIKHVPPNVQADESDDSASDASLESAGSRDEEDVTQVEIERLGVLHRVQDLIRLGQGFLCRLIKLLSHDRTVLVALPAVVASRLGRPVVALLIQYVSKNLHWSLAKASILVSIRPAVNIVLYAVILPNLSRALASKLKVAVPMADLLVAKISAAILVLGLLIMGLGKSLTTLITGLIIYTLGWGLGESVTLYLTSRVDESEVATLFSIVSMVSTVGSLAGTPLLAAAFSKEMEIQGVGSGMMFFVAMGAVMMTSLGLWSLRWR